MFEPLLVEINLKPETRLQDFLRSCHISHRRGQTYLQNCNLRAQLSLPSSLQLLNSSPGALESTVLSIPPKWRKSPHPPLLLHLTIQRQRNSTLAPPVMAPTLASATAQAMSSATALEMVE